MPLTGVKLNPKQLQELNEAFIIYDSDGDGRVTKDQAKCVIRSIALSPTNEELEFMLGDRERHFSLKELESIIASKAPPFETEDNLKESIRIFDKEGNGFVDVKELQHVLVQLGEKLKDEEVDELLREVDITGDNQINTDELVGVIKSLY